MDTYSELYNILSTKKHNPHYLKRYIRFILGCKAKNEGLTKKDCYLEAHHICPKADDLFPEYKSFRDYPWNKILLTGRQHFDSHWILWKCYGGSQVDAFWRFSHKQSFNKESYEKILPKVYESLKLDKSKRQSALITEMHKTNPIFIAASDNARKENNVRRKDEQSVIMKNLWENGSIREGLEKYQTENKDKLDQQMKLAREIRWSKDTARADQAEVANRSRKKSEITCPYCNFTGPNIYGNMTRHIKACEIRYNSMICEAVVSSD